MCPRSWSRRRERAIPMRRSDVLESLVGIPVLAVTDSAVALSRAIIDAGAVPAKAIDDALHVAVAAVHGTDYLLTWHYRHIDNAETSPLMRASGSRRISVPCTLHTARTHGMSEDG